DSAAVARLSALPFYNSKLRTTCVATMLTAGHAENALPQAARATVNCRILPGEPASDVEATLRRLAADDRISVSTVYVPIPSPPSPLTPAIDRKSTRLNSSHVAISYAVFCLKKKKISSIIVSAYLQSPYTSSLPLNHS